MSSMLALRNLDVASFLNALDLAKGDVFLVTREGDHLNLKSRLCQLIGLSKLIEEGKIAEAFIVCQYPEDEAKIQGAVGGQIESFQL